MCTVWVLPFVLCLQSLHLGSLFPVGVVSLYHLIFLLPLLLDYTEDVQNENSVKKHLDTSNNIKLTQDNSFSKWISSVNKISSSPVFSVCFHFLFYFFLP